MHNERIRLTECLLRDGLQSMEKVYTTDEKLRLLDAVLAARFPRVEVTSFVPAKVIPQFFDAEVLMREARRRAPAGIDLIAFVPNARGMERVAELAAAGEGPDSVLIVCSATDAHNQRNLRRSAAETKDDHRRAAEIAHKSGLKIIGSISVAFGCPYTGDVSAETVLDRVAHYRAIGAHEVQFGDTTGMANPVTVRRLLRDVMPELGAMAPVAHFHDTRGAAVANSLVALEQGVQIIDTALGGTGGRPPAQRVQASGPTGNTASEDFGALLDEMGYATGLDVDALLTAGQLLQRLAGDTLHAHILHAGRVPHAPEAEPLRLVANG